MMGEACAELEATEEVLNADVKEGAEVKEVWT
jgi:hypothetical protein